MGAFFDIAAAVIVLAAAFGYLNHKLLRLPHTIGLVVIALAVSLAVLGLDALVPSLGLGAAVRRLMAQIDLSHTLMDGMLSFLLFAGALHVDIQALASRGWAIGLTATLGTLVATFVTGVLLWLAAGLLTVELPLIQCLVFGALIAPTDPVAVLGILKRTRVPVTLEAKIAGESLFNDGIGIVVFTVLAGIASRSGGGHAMTAGAVTIFFLIEAVGGVALGLMLGFVAYRVLKSVDEHNLEVLITLALAMGTFALAHALQVSAPIATVCAGLLIGNLGTRFAMSETTREHAVSFWSLIDEVLNSVLFLLIGFEVVAITLAWLVLLAGLVAVPIVLAARFVAISLPISLLRLAGRQMTPGTVRIMTWGGLRGGISVALALSLPPGPERMTLLTVCYIVVLFSILVQGLTLEGVVRRIVRREQALS